MALVREQFPHAVREEKHIFIPMSDGIKLAARLWLPESAVEQPVPALLEYIPYRKNDGTALRDSIRHPYLAGHGYACVRVDLRGSGDSEGILYDEYLPQEQEDGLEVIAWLAAQPWCDGNVGMFGKSWGGFNSLQLAARRPPALKAIIAVCATDDRYDTDVHYIGGALLAYEMLPWASSMLVLNGTPPDPAVWGEQWHDLWLERLEKTPPHLEAWLTHQRRDRYWQHGSVCENYSDIECPVYAVTGWVDGYRAPVFRLLAGLNGPRKGLIGPWGHDYPTVASPGPAIGFLQEMLRWWDYWLKGKETGIMDESMLRVWLQESAPPDPNPETRAGRWVSEPSWPPPAGHIEPTRLYLNTPTLDQEAPLDQPPISLLGDQTHGTQFGTWAPYGDWGDYPLDQRADDAKGISATSEPLAAALEIVGFPTVTVKLAVDQPQAFVSARLCDVAPDGTSALVSYGVLNLTHRESHLDPTDVEPGKILDVTVELHPVAHQIKAGHRWRLTLSSTFWPVVWPSPRPVTLTLFPGSDTYLTLPVRPPRPAEERQLRPFERPEQTPYLPHEREVKAPRRREITVNSDEKSVTLIDTLAPVERIRFLEDGLEIEDRSQDTYFIREGDPRSARIESLRSSAFQRGAWAVRIETTSRMTADESSFYLMNRLNAYEGEALLFSKEWSRSIPRDFV